MLLDRRCIRERSRELIKHSGGAALLIALIFQLTTDWVSLIANLFLQNPITLFVNTVGSSLTGMLQTMSTSGVMETTDMTPAYTQGFTAVRELLLQPIGKVSLFLILLLMLYHMVVQFGYYSHCLDTCREQHSGWQSLFSRFYMATKIILLNVIIGIYCYAWSLLFFLPGVVAWYRCRMAPYLLLDNPEMSVFQAFFQSGVLMRGSKLQLMLLDLSFVPWLLLAEAAAEAVYIPLSPMLGSSIANLLCQVVITAVYVYLIPYRQYSNAGFYLVLRQNMDEAIAQKGNAEP